MNFSANTLIDVYLRISMYILKCYIFDPVYLTISPRYDIIFTRMSICGGC